MAVVCQIEDLKKSFKTIYNFIENNDLHNLIPTNGFVNNGIIFNVLYGNDLNKSNIDLYKSYRKYIDIQIPIDCNASYYVAKVINKKIFFDYDLKLDEQLYRNIIKSKKCDVKKGECIIIYPDDCYKQYIKINKPIKRIIEFKIPYSNVTNIKCLIMDIDGTLTDGKINIGRRGEVYKTFNIKDGFGIKNILFQKNIIPVILTGRKSKIVENRARELNIDYVYQGIENKIKIIDNIAKELNIKLSNIAYIGDDDNDIGCIEYIKRNNGLTGCPYNSSIELLNKCDFISNYNGGDGAVREFIDWLCISK